MTTYTLISEGVRAQGTIESSGVLRIDGCVEGRVRHRGLIIIGPHGRCGPEVQATSMQIAGEGYGEIRVEETLEVLPAGVVRGHLMGGHLEAHEGAVLMVEVDISASAGRAQAPASPESSGSEALVTPAAPVAPEPEEPLQREPALLRRRSPAEGPPEAKEEDDSPLQVVPPTPAAQIAATAPAPVQPPAPVQRAPLQPPAAASSGADPVVFRGGFQSPRRP